MSCTFPSLMFIRRIPYQSVQRRRIRHWLLLAMRLAALALLVMAFARPFFRHTDAAAAAGSGAREVVVLLDRSYSMGYGGRWQKAIAAAQQTINGLTPADRGTIVVFSSNAEVALRSTADRSRLLATVAGVQPGAGATRYGPALKLAGSVLSESGLPRREAVLITDFQRIGWQGAEGVKLPEGAVLSTAPVGDAETANLSVTPVSLQRSTFSNQQRIAVTAGVVNHGPAAVKGVELTLELGGRGVQTQRVNVEPGGSGSVTFDPVTVAEKNVRAAVRLPKDALERDNVFNFVASPEEPVRVILVDRPGASRDDSLYLTRALAVGEAPRFEVTARGSRLAVRRRSRQGHGRDPERRPGLVVARRSPDEVRRRRRRPARSLQGTRRRGPAPRQFSQGSSGMPSTGARGFRPGSARWSTGTRPWRCSAHRAPGISRLPASTDTVRSRRLLARRCWHGTTMGTRRCWSGAADPGGS